MEFEHTDPNVPDTWAKSAVEDENVKFKEISRKSHREMPPVTGETMSEKEDPYNDTTTFEQTYDLMDLTGKVLGWKYRRNWKSNPKHWFTCSLNVFCWSQIIYTQIKCVMRGDYSKIFETFAIYGIAVSCTLKIFVFVQSYQQLVALHHFTWKISRQAGKHLNEKIQNLHRQSLIMCKVITVAGFSTAFIFGYYPIMEFATKQNLVLLLPTEIMFLDQTKLFQFLIANLLMSAIGLWIVLIAISNIIQFAVTVFNCTIPVHIIEDDIRQLDELWRDGNGTLVERHMLLRNICQKCQDKDNYITALKEIFDQPLYYFFCVGYLSEIVCLYEVQVNHWIPGIGIAAGVIIEMLVGCILGTQCSKATEHLCYVLKQSQWYTYDIPSQKIFLNLLNSCMNSQELWIGPLAPLSVLTGIEIVKSIYSYYTFLTTVT